jgi:hypothetical protein
MGRVKEVERVEQLSPLVRKIVAGMSPLKAISQLTDKEHADFVHARPGEEVPKSSFQRSLQAAAVLSFDQEVRLLLDPNTSDRDKLTISGRMMDRAGYAPTQKKQVTLKVEIAPTTIELLEKGLVEAKSQGFLETGSKFTSSKFQVKNLEPGTPKPGTRNLERGTLKLGTSVEPGTRDAGGVVMGDTS